MKALESHVVVFVSRLSFSFFPPIMLESNSSNKPKFFQSVYCSERFFTQSQKHCHLENKSREHRKHVAADLTPRNIRKERISCCLKLVRSEI